MTVLSQAPQLMGLEQGLLKDALLRTVQAADIAGVGALVVHAKGEAARQWYKSWEFEPSPTDSFPLFLMLEPGTRVSHAVSLARGDEPLRKTSHYSLRFSPEFTRTV